MHRLLQGDVGSGKTVVALTACLAAIDSGYQAALMAPTEVLATQHHRQLAPLLEALGLRCALLTAATPRSARESLLALADGGRVDLLVGTHALLAARVSLPNLALAVVDEQHRFGVAQRVRLRQRGGDGCQPHLLVMTATPIPRTMALTLYGDLELSLLDEKPPGRRRIATELHEQPRLTTSDAARARLRGRLERGEQAFVVCPLVEESEKLAVTDVANTTAELARLLPQRRVATVHGRMPSAERDRVMAAFRRREIDVLVATTVIEVGIDVPNANVMVVEHAERFGLAQLHQLRGRVGRAAGERAGLCLLLTTAAESTARERLEVLASTDDGFVIAEADLELRGAGELFGTRQAGVPRLRFADPRRQLELLAKAKRAAEQLVSADPQLGGHPRLRQIVERRWERKPLFGVEAG